MRAATRSRRPTAGRRTSSRRSTRRRCWSSTRRRRPSPPRRPRPASGAASVTLTASVTSTAAVVGVGSVSFALLQGGVPVAGTTTVSAAVSASGVATVSYPLPAGLGAGSYTIQATYGGSTNFITSINSTQVLVVNAAATAVAAAPASTAFVVASQSVNLTATVTSTAIVNVGEVAFVLLQGGLAVPGTTSVSASVSASGVATVSYPLPAGLAPGAYSIQATYNGNTNFLTSVDSGQTLTIAAASTASAAASASAVFSASSQAVGVSATVTSTAGVVDGGSVAFRLVSGATIVAGPVFGSVAQGRASASMPLPPGLAGGAYQIEVTYGGSGGFLASPADTRGVLTVSAASTSLAGGFSADPIVYNGASDQSVRVTLGLVSQAGSVDGGVVTFTLFDGASVVGTSATATVVSGQAVGAYRLPAGLPAGSYRLRASYAGNGNFQPFNPADRTLTISPADATVAASAQSTTYAVPSQSVSLAAAVSSPAGVVDGGLVVFTVLDAGGNPLGNPTTGAVAAGSAMAVYTLPPGLSAGSYTIRAAYQPSANFRAAEADAAGSLIVRQASTLVAVPSVGAPSNGADQDVALSARVTSPAGTVGEGSLIFTILNGTAVVGQPQSAAVMGGVASVSYRIPGGTPIGSFTIRADYAGTASLGAQSATGILAIGRVTPRITWATPAEIAYGTPLSALQLDATASAPGTFAYSPPAGTVLPAGSGQVLNVAFTPDDPIGFTTAAATTSIRVVKARPTFIGISAPVIATYNQAGGAVVSGRLIAPTAVPAAQVVSISIGNASAQAAVQEDGSFAATIDLHGLAAGTYSVAFAYAGNANFDPAVDGSAGLVIAPASQSIALVGVPASATYGSTFRVTASSDSGLPVALTGTGCTVVPDATGGFLVTMTTGTGAAVLTATQAGDANHLATEAPGRTVAARKAEASVTLSNLSVPFNGQGQAVTASTNPAGLSVILSYFEGGRSVARPTAAGNYDVTATIDDPNYQGSARGTLSILVPAVQVATVKPTLSRSKALTTLTVTFTGALNQASAQTLANYKLTTADRRGSFDSKTAPVVKLKSAQYSAGTNLVKLTLARPLALTRILQLRISGTLPKALMDASGRAIDGNRDRLPGGDALARIGKGSKARVTLLAIPTGRLAASFAN
ncbi:MAG: Ig-like domain repeat protein [Isosphaeraceae bacterium]